MEGEGKPMASAGCSPVKETGSKGEELSGENIKNQPAVADKGCMS
jgi:hypothetical protein